MQLVVDACLSLLLGVSQFRELAKLLVMNNLDQLLCLSFGSIFDKIDEEEVSMETGGSHGNEYITGTWMNSLSLVSNLLDTLDHIFVQTAIDFTGVHAKQLLQVRMCCHGKFHETFHYLLITGAHPSYG